MSNGSTSAKNHQGTYLWLLVSLLPLSLFIALVSGLNHFSLPWQLNLPWVPSLNIALRFRVDSLTALMLLLITGIGTMIFIYAVGYLTHDPNRKRIFLVLPMFMVAMMGAVSADDVFLLFAFWELTSITSFLLVGYKHQKSEARDSARQALFITMGGGLALLAGLILLSDMAGTTSLSGIIRAAPDYAFDEKLSVAIVLILIGAFTKSAQFPFHFWLPNAMLAPTPVSAYLHSATMVKLGIYLMARFDAAFNDFWMWEFTLISVGTTTAVWAAILALRERDLKRILARSTISALGTLTLLIGLPGSGEGLAVVAFLFAHAVYKAPLFMVAGNIDHATGTRRLDCLMGLRRVMPVTAAIAILSGLSMAGLPLAFGFVAKDIITIAKDQADVLEIVSYALLFVNATAVAVAAVAAIRVFWGPLYNEFSHVREVSWLMLLPPLVLALLGIELELLPNFVDPLLISAAQAISPDLEITQIGASYSIQNLLSATGLTASIGLLLFIFWDRLHARLSRIRWLDEFGPEATYHFLLEGFKKLAALHTRLLQSGKLDSYLLMTMLSILIMIGFVAMQSEFEWKWVWDWQQQGWAWLVAGMLIMIGAIAAVGLKDRFSILMAAGLVGYGISVLFLFAGAPDLAFTQFTVETVLVVVAVALLPLFRSATVAESRIGSPLKLIVALLAGVGTFFLLTNMLLTPENDLMKAWFSNNSWVEANGRNVVNVILVDFRAIDTLGEITVVAFSLLAAIPLLKQINNQQSKSDSNSVLLNKAALPIYWIILVGALWILLRGHNEPGGGFIGGLVAATGSSLLAIVFHPRYATQYLPLAPVKMAMIGLILAMSAGLFGLFYGATFMQHFGIGLLSTVILFDIGVFLAVWGSFSGYVFGLLERASPTKTEEPTP